MVLATSRLQARDGRQKSDASVPDTLDCFQPPLTEKEHAWKAYTSRAKPRLIRPPLMDPDLVTSSCRLTTVAAEIGDETYLT